MVRTIIAVLLLLLCIYIGYFFWWVPRQKTIQADSGSYTCTGCLTGEAKERFLRENSGDTPDGQSERKDATARAAAEASANESANASPAQITADSNHAPGTSAMVAPSTAAPPAPSSDPSYASPAYVPAPAPASVPSATYNSLGAPPAGDSIAPNPPNGAVFAGRGSFQWYRQGNITWRVDTSTGRSCIIYATMEEWQKRIVLSHGCGRNA